MPVSRKRKKVVRKRREKIGNRSAASGQFVTEKFAKDHPSETVAVTKEVEPELDADSDVDKE